MDTKIALKWHISDYIIVPDCISNILELQQTLVFVEPEKHQQKNLFKSRTPTAFSLHFQQNLSSLCENLTQISYL